MKTLNSAASCTSASPNPYKCFRSFRSVNEPFTPQRRAAAAAPDTDELRFGENPEPCSELHLASP